MVLDQYEPIRLPDNLNARIWRYVDVQKLESILKDRALYFCRGDRFEDPYEVRACFHRLEDRGSGYFADPSTRGTTDHGHCR